MPKKHIMLDLETMGLDPNAAIISIGAVHFTKDELLEEFYTAVSLKSCVDLGLTMTQSTIDWLTKLIRVVCFTSRVLQRLCILELSLTIRAFLPIASFSASICNICIMAVMIVIATP